jgi:hypothetical protein
MIALRLLLNGRHRAPSRSPSLPVARRQGPAVLDIHIGCLLFRGENQTDGIVEAKVCFGGLRTLRWANPFQIT